MSNWLPTLHTAPLSADFPTDGERLIKVVDVAWKSPESNTFALDDWQKWLLRHVLERYPADHPVYPGQLRYRQVVISLGRQNGKSVLGAIFGLYGLLLHTQGAEVIGIAYTKEQADIIFKRVKYVIDSNPFLTKRFKATSTRGLYTRDNSAPASYNMKSKAEETLQGVTISLCLYDEVHLTKPETWDAVLFGTSARKDGLVLGITTAGDDNSVLLKRLYANGKRAVEQSEGFDERFGFFLWEAPDGCAIDDPEAIKSANPAVACGRKDLAVALSTITAQEEHKARRYGLNQFTASSNPWLSTEAWKALEVEDTLPHHDDITFAVDRAENWRASTITASVKHEGRVHTKIVTSTDHTNIDALEETCLDLWNRFGGKFVMEQSTLKDLSARLREQGLEVEYLTATQMSSACQTVYAMVKAGRIVHAGDMAVYAQVVKGVAKNNSQGGWSISRRESSGDIDALLATIMGVYGSETYKPNGPMLYVA